MLRRKTRMRERRVLMHKCNDRARSVASGTRNRPRAKAQTTLHCGNFRQAGERIATHLPVVAANGVALERWRQR